MTEKDYEIYKNFVEVLKKDSTFNKFLSAKEYYKYQELFKKHKKNYIQNKEKGLEKILSKKMIEIVKDYLDIYAYSNLRLEVEKDFNNDPENESTKLIIKNKLKEMMKNSEGIANPKAFITDFHQLIRQIDELGQNKENYTIKDIKSNYHITKNYLENSSSIRFLLVGPHNAGKSTLLNTFIGYNRTLLESAKEECTKISVIIKYSQKTENPKLYEAIFKTNDLGYNYFEYDENNILAEGDNEIKKKIIDLNRKNSDKTNLRYYFLKTPIEIFDRLIEEKKEKIQKIKEIVEKIELIDFPGLDTNFEKAKKNAEDLLIIVDGFIYVNFSINFESANRDIFALIYNSIKDRNNFSFNNCLFILNKIDLEENKNVDYDEVAQKILKIFDEQNNNINSKIVLERKERINDKALALTPFSCYRYKEFKKLEYDIQNFEDFIRSNMFSGSNKSTKIKVIIKNLKEEYLENIKSENINIQNNILKKEYINRLQNLLKEENIKKYKENELDKIVKLYFYLLNNIKKVKVYQLCCIDNLLHNFQIVIEETYNFFKFKLQQDALSFIIKSYEEILDFYYIVKLRMSDDNIDKFKQLNKDQILKNLNDKEEETINNIKELFKKKKKKILKKIKKI
jgi:hypothetical protein